MVLSRILPQPTSTEKPKARQGLLFSALFLGELRDGLTMINMQSAFLIVSKGYTEKQAGVLFFVFGMSQFLFQTPAGYLFDYTEQKVLWLSSAAVATTFLTVMTAAFAKPYGANLPLMIFVKFLQGAVTSFIPPGLNSITRGIVGGQGMTEQVAINEMMNHLGTAIIVLIGSIIGYMMYPNLGLLFVVSPIACAGVLIFLKTIPTEEIDHAAARGLEKENLTTTKEYTPPAGVGNESAPNPKKPLRTQPSFNFGGWQSLAGSALSSSGHEKADTPSHILRDPVLLMFILAVFLFHLSNGTVLPLVMQTLALEGGRSGILLSGSCIIVAQVFMVCSARICGEYSGKYGRKPLFLIGLFSVPVRCLILTMLVHIRGDEPASSAMLFVMLSTQILDGVGAGVFGTMYILVTSDLSQGTGRFSLTLGLTTAAMSIGGTVSGYLGEALAQDLGYEKAFFILMFLALAPALLYLLFMPETLVIKPSPPHRIESIMEGDEEEDHKVKAYTELV